MKNPFELYVAFRYLRSARKEGHTAFLSLISTLGLAVGVATLLISLSLLSGLQGKIKARLMASSPQVLIEPSGSNGIAEADQILRLAREAGATSAQGLIRGIAWASDPEGKRGRPVRIRSFDPAKPPRADSSFGREWSLRQQGEGSLLVTRDFAAAMQVTLGDEIILVAPRARLTPFGQVPVLKQCRITRLLPPGGDENDPDAQISFDEASALFATASRPTSIEIYAPVAVGDALQKSLTSRFPELQVKSWKEINKPLFLALRLEKVVMFATISLIIFVAALNLVSSLSMLIVEKRQQVGILRTMGASERSILRIFLFVGLLIGTIGTFLGNAIGLGASWAANRYHLIPVPGEAYYVSYIPFSIDMADVVGVNLVAIVLSVLATYYPARIAARLDPITAIRDE